MKIGFYDTHEIEEGFHSVPIKGACNIGLYIKNGKALVIDSGRTPEDGREVIMGLKQHGIEPELLFITHYHNDHTFGNQYFSCPILSSDKTLEMMKECIQSHWSRDEIKKYIKENPKLAIKWRELVITFPTETFSDEYKINFQGTNVIFRKVGGHSPGASIVYIPEYKVVFTGDIVFGERYPVILEETNPNEMVEVLDSLSKLDIEYVIPGHGQPGDQSMIRKLSEYYQCLLAECGRLCDSDMGTEKIKEVLVNCCCLPAIPADKIKHKANIETVLSFLKNK